MARTSAGSAYTPILSSSAPCGQATHRRRTRPADAHPDERRAASVAL